MKTQVSEPQYNTMEPVARIPEQDLQGPSVIEIECPFCNTFMGVPILSKPAKTLCTCGSYLTIPAVTVEIRAHKLPDDWEY